MKRVDAHMEDELWLDVRCSAKSDGRSINAQIRYLLRYALIDWHNQQQWKKDGATVRREG